MKLPQCEIIFQHEIFDSEILFVSGGRKPEKNYFLKLAENRKIICVDKGIDICRENNILPEILIGDFDSAEKNSVDWAIDHLFSTIFTCANCDKKIFLADEQEIIFFLKENETAEIKFFKKPVAISLLPISEICEGVNIDNVHWTLDNAKLFQKQ